MNKLSYAGIILVVAAALSVACQTADTRLDPPGIYGIPGAPGCLYGGVKGNVSCQVEDGCSGDFVGSKTGEACSSIILFGLVATGDMSIQTAAKQGRIKKIGTVDYSQMNVLGTLYLQKCTIVTGE